MRVLISAYACSPFQGSEASMGWGFVKELSKHHELTVFVEAEKFQADIERYLSSNNTHSKIHFIFVKKERNRWLRKLWPPSYYKYYKEWHLAVFKIAEVLSKQQKFDIAHQLTMSGFREPGFLWKLKIPFVWGPVGAMGYFPKSFLVHIGLKGFVHHLAYNIYNFVHMNYLRRPQMAARHAGLGFISATTDNQARFKKHWFLESSLINEIGVPPLNLFSKPSQREEGEPLRIVWSGIHTPRKALNIALKSLSMLPTNTNFEFHILGVGEQTATLIKYANKLGISKNCIFHGMLARDEALTVMTSAHLMLITSLRDLTSAVTVESISLSLPVICLDHSGFSDVIDRSCGIKIPLTNFKKVSQDIADAISLIEKDESYRRELSTGSGKRADCYSWEKKIKDLNMIYLAKLNEGHD
ncbi:glycosyltransferase [Gammaproteobacteria bacterium]|nr:glycosyltransferase [Gammaproteobacteria bacterium]